MKLRLRIKRLRLDLEQAGQQELVYVNASHLAALLDLVDDWEKALRECADWPQGDAYEKCGAGYAALQLLDQ